MVKRGDLCWVNLNPVTGSEQASRRPVVIVQNDIGNALATTTIIAPLTTKSFHKSYPVNVHIPKDVAGLTENSTVLLAQIRVVDKTRLGPKLGHVPSAYMRQINQAIKISLGL